MTTEMTRSGGITNDQIDLVKRTICAGSTDDELQLFVQTANRLGLDPFARQVFAVKRWDSRSGREIMSIQVSIDGFRLIAERTKKYAGQLGPLWTGDGKAWVEVWLESTPPKAAKVGVMRHDFKEPIWAVATWDQYKQTKKDGGLTAMWHRMGPLMIAKCAESLALRRAFPQELSGAYTDAEMAQAETPDYIPPKEAPQDRPKDAPTADALSTTSSTNGAGTNIAPQGALLSKPLRANGKPMTAADIKPTGGPITPEQVKAIHAMLPKLGNVTDIAYRTQLAVYRQADGSRCVDPATGLGSSKFLSKDQASHLLDRFQAKLDKQERRAADVPDIGAAVPPVDDLLQRAFTTDDEQADWLAGLWGVRHPKELDAKESATCLQLLVAMSQGEDVYEAALTKARDGNLVR